MIPIYIIVWCRSEEWRNGGAGTRGDAKGERGKHPKPSEVEGDRGAGRGGGRNEEVNAEATRGIRRRSVGCREGGL